MNSSRTYLIDKKSPLKVRDYEILFDSSSKRADLRRIASKIGLKRLEPLTKIQIIDAIGRRLRYMNIREPVKFGRKRGVVMKKEEFVNNFNAAATNNVAANNAATNNVAANNVATNNGFKNNGFKNNGFKNNGFKNNGFKNNGFKNNGFKNNNSAFNNTEIRNNFNNPNRRNNTEFPKNGLFRRDEKPKFLGGNRPAAPKSKSLFTGLFGGKSNKNFIKSDKFNGAKNGYVFKTSNKGTGYYKNTYRPVQGPERNNVVTNRIGEGGGNPFKNVNNQKEKIKNLEQKLLNKNTENKEKINALKKNANLRISEIIEKSNQNKQEAEKKLQNAMKNLNQQIANAKREGSEEAQQEVNNARALVNKIKQNMNDIKNQTQKNIENIREASNKKTENLQKELDSKNANIERQIRESQQNMEVAKLKLEEAEQKRLQNMENAGKKLSEAEQKRLNNLDAKNTNTQIKLNQAEQRRLSNLNAKNVKLNQLEKQRLKNKENMEANTAAKILTADAISQVKLKNLQKQLNVANSKVNEARREMKNATNKEKKVLQNQINNLQKQINQKEDDLNRERDNIQRKKEELNRNRQRQQQKLNDNRRRLDENRRRQENNLKRQRNKQEEAKRKAREEEVIRKAREEEIQRKQSEEIRRKQLEEIRLKKEEENRKKKEEENRKKKEEENRRKKKEEENQKRKRNEEAAAASKKLVNDALKKVKLNAEKNRLKKLVKNSKLNTNPFWGIEINALTNVNKGKNIEKKIRNRSEVVAGQAINNRKKVVTNKAKQIVAGPFGRIGLWNREIKSATTTERLNVINSELNKRRQFINKVERNTREYGEFPSAGRTSVKQTLKNHARQYKRTLTNLENRFAAIPRQKVLSNKMKTGRLTAFTEQYYNINSINKLNKLERVINDLISKQPKKVPMQNFKTYDNPLVKNNKIPKDMTKINNPVFNSKTLPPAPPKRSFKNVGRQTVTNVKMQGIRNATNIARKQKAIREAQGPERIKLARELAAEQTRQGGSNKTKRAAGVIQVPLTSANRLSAISFVNKLRSKLPPGRNAVYKGQIKRAETKAALNAIKKGAEIESRKPK
jgi:hypothetical protein